MVISPSRRTGSILRNSKQQDHTALTADRWRAAFRSLVLTVFVLVSTFGGSAWGAGTLVNEPMTGSTALGWVLGGSAYLTASSGADPVGSGWLRLTDPGANEAGYGYLDTAFDVTQGAVIQFDYTTWGGAGDGGFGCGTTGADGYSIYLFDGSKSFSVGASGGSLGYAQKTVAPVNAGLNYGYIGVGIDEWGNFSNPTEGRIGGPGGRCDAVAVRGPYNHPSGAYYYLGGTASNIAQLAFPAQGYRPDQSGAQYRKVVIYLTPQSAPNYLRVDVYLQVGYNQALTQVVTGLMTGQPVPASVKIGYAASTGGSTNYHEIRNLTVDPLSTDINLTMFKTVSAPTVTAGGQLTYTVTARNYGPNNITANNVPIIDTMPALLTNVTWTCTGANGGTCGAASGNGSINTTATLPLNASVTYAIKSTVMPTATLGSQIVNTASLTPPSNDYNSSDNSASATSQVVGANVAVSGYVYNDANHNSVLGDAGDALCTTATCLPAATPTYAKIFLSNNLTTALAVVAVNTATAQYSLTVPQGAYYTVILSSDNTTNFTPSFGTANWIYTSPIGYTISNVYVGSSGLTGLNFGVYNGTRIDGRVFRDDGSNGGITDANDGTQNAAEVGLSGVQVQLVRDSNPATIYDGSVTTDSQGNFSLFTNTASKTLRIVELANPAGYLSVSYNAGNAATPVYTIAGDYISFAYTLYTNVTGVRFGDVPDNSFTPASRAQNGTSLNPVYYAHTFTPGSGGTVSFAVSSRTRGTWPAVAYYNDTNCSGTYNAGDTLITGATTTVSAGTPLCLLVKETIPVSAPTGTTDQLVTQATFTFTNSVGPVSKSYTVTDTTTVIAGSDLSTSSKTWTDLNGGDQNPGDVIQYTITLNETAGLLASGVTVTDNMPPNVTGFTVVSYPAGATNSSTPAGGANGTGYLNISNISVPASGSATVVFNVTIANGTAAGTLINNSATISNPGNIGGTPTAPTITVSVSQVPSTGNKSLYLYDSTSTPAYKLSRTPVPTNPVPGNIALASGATQTWTLSPVLQSQETLATSISNTIPVTLYLTSTAATTVAVSLACSSGGTSISSGSLSIAALGTQTAEVFSLSLNGVNQTCPTGSSWKLGVKNNTAGTVRVYPAYGSNRSVINLPCQNVITVMSVNAYSTAYPGTTVPAYFSPGTTIYTRATVSDPFGSYDITSATVTIKNTNNTVVVNNAVMTQVFDSGAATKVFEYAYTTLPSSGPNGSWTFTVTAQEGLLTEIPVPPSDNRTGTFPVVALFPSLVVVKSVVVSSDPINGTSNPKAIPGAVMLYTITVTNSGSGTADSSSIAMTDPIPANTTMYIDPTPSNSVTFSCSAAPACGLTWNYATNVTYSNQAGGGPPFTYTPSTGYDPNIKGVQIIPTGVLNGGNANFTVTYKVQVN